VKQMPGLKKKFLKYIDYRNVNLEDIITPKQKGNSAEMKAEIFSSSFIKNDKGKLVITDLPAESQIAPVFSIAVEDINNDSHPDMILCGNLLATQPDFGRYDASIGVILLGDGTGKWHPMDAMKSGLAIQGEIRDIQIVTDRQKKKKILFARNNESIRGYSVK